MASKIKINYYLNVLYVYDVISIYSVLGTVLNNEANKIKKAAAL